MKRTPIRDVSVIDNNEPNTLRGVWEGAIAKASMVDIGVAFVTGSGLSLVKKSLKKAALRGNVRVLTGLYQYFTEPEALYSLLELQSLSNGQLSVRISRDEHFHWKAYFFFNASTVSISIGSSNLTAAGLQSSGELSLTVSLPRASTAFNEIHAIFESEWKRAAKLNEGVITRYEQNRPANAGTSIKVPVAKILGRPEAPRRSTKPITIQNRVEKLRYHLTSGQCAAIGKIVADQYRERYGQSPEQIWEDVDGVFREVYVYPSSETSLVDRAIKQAIGAEDVEA